MATDASGATGLLCIRAGEFGQSDSEDGLGVFLWGKMA